MYVSYVMSLLLWIICKIVMRDIDEDEVQTEGENFQQQVSGVAANNIEELKTENGEEVLGIVEDSHHSSNCTQKTSSLTTNHDITSDSQSSFPAIVGCFLPRRSVLKSLHPPPTEPPDKVVILTLSVTTTNHFTPSPHAQGRSYAFTMSLLLVPLLKLCQKPHSDVILSQYSCWEVFKQVEKVAILHRKMIPRGKLLLLKSFAIFRFDIGNSGLEYVTAKFRCCKVTVSDFGSKESLKAIIYKNIGKGKLNCKCNSNYVMLAILVCFNTRNVRDAKVLLKWKALPLNMALEIIHP